MEGYEKNLKVTDDLQCNLEKAEDKTQASSVLAKKANEKKAYVAGENVILKAQLGES